MQRRGHVRRNDADDEALQTRVEIRELPGNL